MGQSEHAEKLARLREWRVEHEEMGDRFGVYIIEMFMIHLSEADASTQAGFAGEYAHDPDRLSAADARL